jgi:hypothetical protein
MGLLNWGLFIACAAGAVGTQAAFIRLLAGHTHGNDSTVRKWGDAAAAAVIFDITMMPSVWGAQGIYNRLAYRGIKPTAHGWPSNPLVGINLHSPSHGWHPGYGPLHMI